jgi:hypothetical protein
VRTVTTSIGAPPFALVYGHTTMNAPYLVRTAKLSIVRPCQYYGGGPRGNPRCCRLSFAMLFAPFWLVCVSHRPTITSSGGRSPWGHQAR